MLFCFSLSRAGKESLKAQGVTITKDGVSVKVGNAVSLRVNR